MPKALATKPRLNIFHQDYFKAFLELHERRGPGFSSPNPIKHSEMESYAGIHGFLEVLEFFCKAITALDNTYLDHIAKKQKAEEDAKKNK